MENKIIKSGLKNTIFLILAQSVSLILGISKVLILPILLGVTNYGYWQVYLLYISYVAIFAFGFNDGIYLRYGKYNYEDLPKSIFRTSIKLFIVIQLIITVLVALLIPFESDINKQIAMTWASINIPIAGLSGVLIYIFQITNQFKKYSFYTVLDKIIVLILIFLMFFLKTSQFIIVIIADTFSKIVVLVLMSYSCRDIIFGQGCSIKTAYKELYKNISVGIKLMLANFAGMLVLGFGRFVAERFESVETYGAYSFANSTINLILIFISAISLVIYPTLNRVKDTNYPKYFVDLNKILSILLFGLLLIYFPVRVFINKVMIEYIQIFDYLPIIFATMLVQIKMQILIYPFYQLLRKEAAMLKLNVIGLLMSVIIIVPIYYIRRSIFMIALGTFIVMEIRLYFSELYLKRLLVIDKNNNIAMECFGIILFIYFAYQTNLLTGFLGYLLAFSAYLVLNLKTLRRFTKYFIKG